MAISADDVMRLRDRTGAGVMDCKRALTETEGDFDKAAEWLRRQGLITAAKKASRSARDGVIASYIHHGSKLGVLVEVNCETDFVARTEDFTGLARDLAIQVAGMNPEYVDRDQVPADAL
jgi:elongation factor Ts